MRHRSNQDVECSTFSGPVQETAESPDAIVVGAGLIGCAISWLLARAGRSVHLIDAGKLGGEASSAGAGMLAPGGEYKEPSAHAHFATESLAMYPGFVQQLESDSGSEIDFRNCGAIELAFTAEEWWQLRRQADVQRRFGIAVDPICISALGTLVPGLESENLRGALFYPKECCVDLAICFERCALPVCAIRSRSSKDSRFKRSNCIQIGCRCAWLNANPWHATSCWRLAPGVRLFLLPCQAAPSGFHGVCR